MLYDATPIAVMIRTDSARRKIPVDPEATTIKNVAMSHWRPVTPPLSLEGVSKKATTSAAGNSATAVFAHDGRRIATSAAMIPSINSGSNSMSRLVAFVASSRYTPHIKTRNALGERTHSKSASGKTKYQRNSTESVQKDGLTKSVLWS